MHIILPVETADYVSLSMDDRSMTVVCREQYGLTQQRRDYVQSADGRLLQEDRSPRHTSVLQLFRTVFLPQGYPDSVSDDYTEYQVILTLTLTLMIQDSSPFSHRTMLRFSKLKLVGLGGLGMMPVRSLL